MILNQFATAAETLPAGDEVIETGQMSECTSVIIFYNRSGGRFLGVRGRHGSGGIGAIDFDDLFAGVPGGPQTVIYVIPGNSYQHSEYGLDSQYDTFDESLPATHQDCTIVRYPPTGNIAFRRDHLVGGTPAPEIQPPAGPAPLATFTTSTEAGQPPATPVTPMVAFLTRT